MPIPTRIAEALLAAGIEPSNMARALVLYILQLVTKFGVAYPDRFSTVQRSQTRPEQAVEGRFR